MVSVSRFPRVLLVSPETKPNQTKQNEGFQLSDYRTLQRRNQEFSERGNLMAERAEYRIFVGGLSWDITERQLESAFNRFGKIIDSQIMMEKDTGRPRGFGFITFSDRRGMDDAIREMHGQELGDRTISVNKAEPKIGEDGDRGYRGGYSNGGRGSYGVGGGDRSVRQDECFKCGRHGHWARDCPSLGGGRGRGGDSFPSRSRFGDSDRGDRFAGEHNRYVDDRYEGGRIGDRDRFESSRDDKYGSRDRYVSDRYPPGGDRLGSSRLGDSDRFPLNGYGKDRGYYRDGGPRGVDKYGRGGPARDEGRSYRNRPAPYDRPSRTERASSFDRY